MGRYVIQSGETGHFLAHNADDGTPGWVMCLRDAGVVDDLETCAQLIEDHLDPWHAVHVVNLDCLDEAC